MRPMVKSETIGSSVRPRKAAAGRGGRKVLQCGEQRRDRAEKSAALADATSGKLSMGCLHGCGCPCGLS